NSAISCCAALQESGRAMKRLLRTGAPVARSAAREELIAEVLRGIAAENTEVVRQRLPRLLKELSRLPLLYVPLDSDGAPREILAARNLQSLLKSLLVSLPRLGLFRETWHVLRTAYVMERTSPPGGMSITEFDRLLEAALQSTLQALLKMAGT